MLPRLPHFPVAGPAARTLALATMAFLLLSHLAGAAASASEPGINVRAPWIRIIIPARPAAGYLILVNSGDEPRTLVGASSAACGTLMMHQSVSIGGVAQMATVRPISVPAHGEVAFAPGGYHLMCMSPAPSIKPGTSVPVTLNFADGGSVTADFPVRNAVGK